VTNKPFTHIVYSHAAIGHIGGSIVNAQPKFRLTTPSMLEEGESNDGTTSNKLHWCLLFEDSEVTGIARKPTSARHYGTGNWLCPNWSQLSPSFDGGRL
jgi:hypothetical protein